MPQRRNRLGQYISDKVKVKCFICEKEKEVQRCRNKKNKHHFCSRKCEIKWRKKQHFSLKTEFKKGEKGYKKTKEWKENIAKAHRGMKKPWAKNLPQLFKKGHSYNQGENHPNFKGGITPENKKIRNSKEYKKWRKAVFKYDNWTCWICEIRGGKLHPHHLNRFAEYPKLRFIVRNGLTLCEFCHKIYTKFGNKN